MEIWNRKQAELQYDWDVADFEIEEVTLNFFSPQINNISISILQIFCQADIKLFYWNTLHGNRLTILS